MASFCEIFQLDDVLEAPGGDGIGKPRNGLVDQGTVLNFNIAGFRTAIGQHLKREVFVSPVDQVLVVRLAADRPKHAEVVLYRYFLGLSIRETAELLDVATGTVDNRWAFAKAWLRREIGRHES